MHPTRLMIDINKLRVASPCSVGWDNMSGDERARHCASCKLHVYNIAGMTNAEVQHLVANRESRLCIRLFRRPDGTVITKDCPVGLRAYQKRVAKFAGTTLSVLLAFVGLGTAQGTSKTKDEMNPERKVQKLSANELAGMVVDSAGASIPGATIKIFKDGEKKSLKKTKSDDDGRYSFSSLSAGRYRLEAKFRNFKKKVFNNIKIIDGSSLTLNFQLELADITVVVGIIAEEPLIDTSSSSVTTKITRRQIDGLPY